MNCVHVMPTSFWFKPTKTTAEIRVEKNDPTFDYHLVCAKICGAAHFNMKIKVVVESKAEYNKWLASQKPRFGSGVTEMRAENAAEAEIKNKEIVSIK
jgi:cytochrome c oxidase subunit 2